MSRFARIDGQPNYSDIRPEHFDAADPEFIVRDGVKRRAIDEPPTPASLAFDERRNPFANVGHAGHKRR